MHLSVTFILPFLYLASSSPNADQESKRLMTLLKDSIDLKQVEALAAFTDPKFGWDTCKGVLELPKYLEMLKRKSEIAAVNTDWSVIDAHFNRSVLYFTIHTNRQQLAYYPDWHFEAKENLEMKKKFVLTRGKLDKCGKLDERP